MGEQLRENYFLAIRFSLLLILEVYIVLSQSILTGASGKVLLLLALLVGVMAGKEFVRQERKWILFALAVVFVLVMITMVSKEFILLGVLLCYELISFIKPGLFWYGIPIAIACVPSQMGIYVQLHFTLLLGMILHAA